MQVSIYFFLSRQYLSESWLQFWILSRVRFLFIFKMFIENKPIPLFIVEEWYIFPNDISFYKSIVDLSQCRDEASRVYHIILLLYSGKHADIIRNITRGTATVVVVVCGIMYSSLYITASRENNTPRSFVNVAFELKQRLYNNNMCVYNNNNIGMKKSMPFPCAHHIPFPRRINNIISYTRAVTVTDDNNNNNIIIIIPRRIRPWSSMSSSYYASGWRRRRRLREFVDFAGEGRLCVGLTHKQKIIK